MSLSLPKHLNVLISPRGAIVLGMPNQACSLSESVLNEAALLQSFDRLLEGCNARKVRIFISAALVDHLVLPGFEHWLKNDDLIALAGTRLAGFYGTDQSLREVVVLRGKYGESSLVTSVSKSLLGGLQEIAKARKARLAGVFPSVALVMRALRRELKNTNSTAIWLEEPGSLLIGFRENGRWLSLRGVAASVMQHTKPSDILQREHLSAGLPKVDRIYFGTLNKDGFVQDAWRQSGIDFSDRLNVVGTILPAFNFLGKRRNGSGLFLLAGALVMLLVTAFVWNDRMYRHADILSEITKNNAIANSASEEEQRVKDLFEQDYRHALSAYSAQMAPWKELFTALNDSGGETLGLTMLAADALEGTLIVEGEAKRFDDIQVLSDKLAEYSLLHDGKITSMHPGNDTSDGRIRFGFGIHWESNVFNKGAIKP